jgi:CRISPR-associated protein Cas2
MPRRNLSGYKGMWLFVMFDLPVVESEERLDYTRFRKRLLGEGFVMLQYSVYARYYPSEEASAAERGRVRGMLPRKGQVRLLSVTDRQFGKMEVLVQRKRERVERKPEQMVLL